MQQNLLYYGDNLDVLRRHIHDETVDLCYIDPPFNSKRNYNQIYNNIGQEDHAQAQAFVDTWTWDDHANDCLGQILTNVNAVQTPQSIDLIYGLDKVLGRGSLFAYLVNMTVRIAEIRRVLKPTGSFYLHCDPTASHYLKLICDSIFVSQGGDFKSEIIWKRSSAHSDTKQGRRQHGRIHDVILFYVKGNNWIWNPIYTPYDEDYANQMYKYTEPKTGRRYGLFDLTGPGGAAKGNPQFEIMGVTRYWRFSEAKVRELIEQGRIVQMAPGSVPRQKRYLDEMPGIPLQDVWTDIYPIGAQAAERLGYPTQKPESLLERIIGSSSNEGDTVLDAYCGCGTTTSVAQRLKRRWIGIDITYQSISLVLRRLEKAFGKKVLGQITLNGIPRDVESAVALAHKKDDRVRKEFEKWAVLTYTNNRAIINDKKGADRGIDGTAYFMTSKKDNAKIVFQVKSGHVGRSVIATLRGDMEREKAAMAVLITLEKPSHVMVEEAKAAGTYHHEMMGRSYDRIQIVTIKEIIQQDARLDVPTSLEVLKAARSAARGSQMDLEYSAA
ncbi:MAG TPA: DNA methyltransferase [Pyrinomonadaceae bacterium]|nr:DNA methyltransferase [Pyrinomonadaceae bacterium]